MQGEPVNEIQPESTLVAADDFPAVIQHIKLLVSLPGYKENTWTKKHDQVVEDFCTGPGRKVLFLYMVGHELYINQNTPHCPVNDVMFLVTDIEPGEKMGLKSFKSKVQHGFVCGNVLKSLLLHLENVFFPALTSHNQWHKSIKTDFMSQFQKFMATLTDTTYHLEGRTVLYVPKENFGDISADANDKELVIRLETLVVQWTRHIKEVLNSHNSNDSGDRSTPIDELSYWKARCDDLSGIYRQLHDPKLKHILNILEYAKSPYLEHFHRCADLINEGTLEAQDNLKFLSLMVEPCENLDTAEPKNILSILPRLLMIVRFIWKRSKLYNTDDLIVGLLQKINNQVINRCIDQINLEDIFFKDVLKSVAHLNECIHTCDQWKNYFNSTTKSFWSFDEGAIFAQLDAFIQRCRDLLEICEAQVQFARKTDSGACLPLPHFGNTLKVDLGKGLEDIESTFNRLLIKLWGLRDEILDVKGTKWYDEYNAFKQGVKDLEIMMQKLIMSAFHSSMSTCRALETLEIFFFLAKRDAIKRTVEKKCTEMWSILISELTNIKAIFEAQRKAPEILRTQPDFAGSGYWARALQKRATYSMNLFNSAYFLPQNNTAQDANTLYESLIVSIDEYTNKCHREWIESIDMNVGKGLGKCIFSVVNKTSFDANFDKNITKIFPEINYFQKLKQDIPFQLLDVYRKRDDLRITRENVLMVCRDYNEIMTKLSTEEQQLFKERLRTVEKKLKPGLSKLAWDSKGVLEVYLKDCKKMMIDLQGIVDSFSHAKLNIKAICQKISETVLVHVETQNIYSLWEYTKAHEAFFHKATSQLGSYFEGIEDNLNVIYDYIKEDGHEIMASWDFFVHKVDEEVVGSLKKAIKSSLLLLSKSIIGENKGRDSYVDVQPILGIEVQLENQKIEFQPTLNRLQEGIVSVAHKVMSVVGLFQPFARTFSSIDDQSREDGNTITSYNAMQDEEFKKLVSAIQQGISNTESKAQKYLRTWDAYKEIWEINKDAFIRRYAKLKPALSTFDADINRYNEVANNIQKEETLVPVDFIRLDCSPLKHSLVGHCNTWQNKLTGLLNTMAHTQLQELHDMMSSNTVKLKKDPTNLDELAAIMQVHESLATELPSIEEEFAPLQEKYQILEKYEVSVTEQEKMLLSTLPGSWNTFSQLFEESSKKLKEVKAKYKSELLLQFDELNKNLSTLRDMVSLSGPYKYEVTYKKADDLLEHYRDTLDEYTVKDSSIRKGLQLFQITEKASKDTEVLETELENLTTMWAIVGEYDRLMGKRKDIYVGSIDLTLLDEELTKLQKKLTKLTKETREWDVYSRQRDQLGHVRKIIPLLQQLVHPSIRKRHWKELMDGMKMQFDPYSDSDFNLGAALQMGLDGYQELITNIASSAAQELNIEKELERMLSCWKQLKIDVIGYKEYLKVRSVDEILDVLEDNQISLSSMKASKFVKAFEHEIFEWEKNISMISELIDVLLVVQKQWIYLENIFIGTEDIRKQLPRESAVFDQVNERWFSILSEIRDIVNVLEIIEKKHIYVNLASMSGDLEQIQKSLDMYLETKRHAFPRFFFISNDDLLEILGQSRNPMSIQVHFKKLFDNIVRLEIKSFGGEQFTQYEALGMYASDSEYVKFQTPVKLEGPVEVWLQEIEEMMKLTLFKMMPQCINAIKKTKKDKWIREWPGQLLLTTALISWTADCTKSLIDTEKGDKEALRFLRKKESSELKRYADLVLTELSKVDRKKLMALITISVHNRDVIEKMIKNECGNVNHFDWTSQLRFYWEQVDNEEDCFIRQINTCFKYGYEYLGNSGRLVITPLTDRCYMTLTTALSLFKGGSPQGPAGTGKTETVKDLGRSLGKFVLIQNCSESLDYRSLGRMFSGLAQVGAWGCFDEFNRIDIEVLSVVAQQVTSILSALSRKAETFIFEGQEIRLNHTCGIFITMNPGYAGRTELPDNLKALFRPVAMVVPDSCLIAEIMLFAEGFGNTKVLAKKIDTLYKLSSQQLSKQRHYDFNLRSMSSALKWAGIKKRSNPTLTDESLIYLSLVESNTPRLVSDDLPLFTSILNDLFPAIELPTIENAELKSAIIQAIEQLSLEKTDALVAKAMQLYDTKLMRHGVMLVGESYSGKSTVWQILQQALNIISKKSPEKQLPVKISILNPKSISLNELYGEFNLVTNEWIDGIFSSILRQICQSEKSELNWLLFDGPVDTSWVESMNTVLDENKVLTLSSGERIALNENISMLFEVENLATASPSTVSRVGMVYMDYKDLGWRPFVDSWIKKKQNANLVSIVTDLVGKYFEVLLDARRKGALEELVPCNELSIVQSFCNLYDALLSTASPDADFKLPETSRLAELWFAYALIWSFGASLKESSRKQFDILLRSIDGRFPTKDTVFEYFVDTESRSWGLWEDKLNSQHKVNFNRPSYKLFIPTVDTLRNEAVLKLLLDARVNVLFVGEVGTGKSSTITQILENYTLANSQKQALQLSMSAQTSSLSVQNSIESRIEKRTKNVYVPSGGKKLIVFIDDFNMPAKDQYGYQSPLELVKHLMQYNCVYDRKKQYIKYIQDWQLVGAMTAVNGRPQVSSRLISRFNLLNVTMPNEISLTRILETILENKLTDFEEEIKSLKPSLASATIDLYRSVSASFLPTPNKTHYLFSMRDMLRLFQGLLKADYHVQDSKEAFIKLWVHESNRVFSDRLNNTEDCELFAKLVDEKLQSHFSYNCKQLLRDSSLLYLNMPTDNGFEYSEIDQLSEMKSIVENRLNEYNSEPGNAKMDIVLFKGCLEQICKISRILSLSNGHMLLLGPGGVGRQTISKLACYISKVDVFTVKPTKSYRHFEFREDLKQLYRIVGIENKQVAFLINDQQILFDSFMQDISNILALGQVPNLFTPEEWSEIRNELDFTQDEQDDEMRLFIDRVRNNLHVILCVSPSTEKFKSWMRTFPALINNTTVNCFTDWPEDALEEVAFKFISNIELEDQQIKQTLPKLFVQTHCSVKEESVRMALEMNRHNIITPVNFLELLSGFKKVLAKKKNEIGQASLKLSNGLQKLEDTKISVEKISRELEQARIQVAKFQKECDDYLVVIVQQKREADDQAKSVTAKAEKLGQEEADVRAVAEAAQEDLDQAMPALLASVKALEAINKKDLNEIRSYGKPPALVEKVMEAVMVLKKSEPSWEEAKRQLGNPSFIKTLINFDKDNISDKILKKITQYCQDENFNPEIVGKVSGAAKSLCMWVKAMETYGTIYRQVLPKREKLKSAQEQLEKKQISLKDAKNKLDEVQQKLAQLKRQYEDKLELKEKLRKDSEEMQMKLVRAEQLVTGLAGEKIRWEAAIKQYEESMALLPGDCVMAAAFISYAGPFETIYRSNLVEKSWMQSIENLMIPHSKSFRLENFVGNQVEIQEWNTYGLPTDAFSVQNGIILSQGDRWPLIIDPQNQASEWIKKLESKKNIKVIDVRQNDYLKQLELSIQYGNPVLLQGIEEKIDPALDPLLSKMITTKGSFMTIKFGDKEVEYNPSFKLYLSTKLPNPHYQPEVFSKTSIINFAVKEKGLEDQLLGIVVKKEKPDLEEQKANLIINVSKARQKLVALEDEILYLLSTAQGSLLDDAKLVEALQSSKHTSEEVTKQLLTSEQTEKRIDQIREGYRPCAERASSLFFVLKDLSVIDPTYQFSLEFYIGLFEKSIASSKKNDEVSLRTENLNKYHTYSLFKTVCRGLFEKHKLLFALRITVKILERKGQINRDEYDYFLKGGIVLDKDSLPINPCKDWINNSSWENLFELDKLPAFNGMMNAIEQNERDWKQWYLCQEPENNPLPSEWENKLNQFEKMMVIRCLRPDRIVFSARLFVSNSLGTEYIESVGSDMQDVFNESSYKVPIMFVLSSGVDPLIQLEQLAYKVHLRHKLRYISLGQGQQSKATLLISEGMREGNWVFLANCHLSQSWLPTLEKIIDSIPHEPCHPDFRLFISTIPHPKIPISILQRSLKMTTEPPRGLKANMSRLLQYFNADQFNKSTKHYQKLAFALSFFHSVLLERKKFLSLGWNVNCDFNDSDFEICEKLVKSMTETDSIPWEALRYLIAEAHYGGRVTDEYDRRVLRSYINHLFSEQAIFGENFALSTESNALVMPQTISFEEFKDFANSLPLHDAPESFGQHPNADVSSQIRQSQGLLANLLSLQPQQATGGEHSKEAKVYSISQDLLFKLPESIEIRDISNSGDPLNVVLLQELKQYTELLTDIREKLLMLQRAIKGFALMTRELEDIANALHDGLVPTSWKQTYFSVKPLASWIEDLISRISYFTEWHANEEPKIHWLAAFTYPNSFLTAVLQRAARKNNVPIDTLAWETNVLSESSLIDGLPTEGICIKGLSLEGAGWDAKNNCLRDSLPMELTCEMPVIHLKPIEMKKKSMKGIFTCPIYYYPIRSGTLTRQSFILSIELKSGNYDAEFFIKRGAAILASLG